jgi:hypothetical protein
VLQAAVLSAATSYAHNAQDQDRKIAQLVVEVAGLSLRDGAPQVVSKSAVDALAAVSGNPACAMSARTTLQLAQLVAAASRDCDAQVRAHAADCVVLAARRGVGQAGCALMLAGECMRRLADVDKRVAGDFLWALGQVGHAALLHPPRLLSRHYSPLLGVREWQRELAGEAGVAGMRALDLPRFISYISQRGHADLPSLLPRMLFVSEAVSLQASSTAAMPQGEAGVERVAGGKVGYARGGLGEHAPWEWEAEVCELWALVEAARFCVRSRLRTSFGGPMQVLLLLFLLLLLLLLLLPLVSTGRRLHSSSGDVRRGRRGGLTCGGVGEEGRGFGVVSRGTQDEGR